MKKFLFFLAAAIAAMTVTAAPVDQAAAQRKAKDYLVNTMYAGKIMAPAATTPVLVKTEISEGKVKKPVYYIYNTSTTYLVVSGDDRAEEILMVGDAPLKMDRIPDALQYLLDCYKEQLTFLLDRPNIQVEKPSEQRRMLRAVTYGPLLTAKWDQEAPYNNLCKFTYNNRTYTCMTGCPATSAAMVFYYWKYPTAQIPAMSSYSGQLDISSSYYSNYVSYTYPALDATTFDWANMRDTYSSSSSGTSATAVATLMRYIGQAEQMMYGVNGSGIYTTETQKVVNMFKNWGYASSCAVKYKSNFTSTNWENLIIAEMAASRPVIYNGVDNSAGGHAFNVDGYRDSDGKYHVNFGWSGDGNNWYAMNAFTYSGYTFSSDQQAVIGIEPAEMVPDPVLTVTPTSLSFTGNTGETYTKTFTVTGENLQGNVTISKSGSAYYTVSPTSLTAAQAQAGAQITVTYKPTSSGSSTATITVASTNAESKTVSVSGTATTVPKITVDPTEVNLTTTVGTAVTQTIYVKCSNLATGAGVSLSCQGTGFSVDKTNITRTAAMNGVNVTVTYNPTTSGTHTGTLTLTSTNAETVVVPLNGTAVGTPKITVNPTALSFTATVGETLTKTFTVTGTDLTGAVMLAVSGNGFSIDKTNITQSAASNGAVVTVTYRPTASGTHTGTVALSSNGAQQVTVALSGIATTTPSITANPTNLDFVTTVGTPVTKSFVLSAAYLEGNVSLAVQGEGFTIDKTSIIPGAANNAYVNVTYTPTTFGTHTGTVTITSPNAQPVTVTLNGQADLVKFAPVMLPADEQYINLTKFRADWTDETPAENLTSYTLEVTLKPTEPETPDPVAVCDLSEIEAVTNDNGQLPNCATTATDYLPEGWSAENYLYINDGFVITGASSSWWSSTYGAIVSPMLDLTGYSKVTVVAKVKSYYPSNYGVGQVRISTNSDYSDYTMGSSDDDDFQTLTVVLNCQANEQIRVQGRANYIAIESVMIYAGDITETAKLMATEQGDANYRLITGITDKFYTVQDLAEAGTFQYRVKALYLDGTESEWSNVEEVTLFENGHGFEVGDVNHDNIINISDVTELINYALNEGGDICEICADINGDGYINISDVTALINNVTNMVAFKPNRTLRLLAD